MITKLAMSTFLIGLAASAQTSAVPGWGFWGTSGTAYQLALDREILHSGKASATIRCAGKDWAQSASMGQAIKSDAYVGKRVRLSAWVRGNKAGHVALWMRVEGPRSEILTFDNMARRGKKGTFEWRQQQIVLDVPVPGILIYFGMTLGFGGQAWIDDVTLEIVSDKVKSTDMLAEHGRPTASAQSKEREYLNASEQPVNLDFEQEQKKTMLRIGLYSFLRLPLGGAAPAPEMSFSGLRGCAPYRAGFNKPMVLPSGSENHAKVPAGIVIGPTNAFPPNSTALSSEAFTSSTST